MRSSTRAIVSPNLLLFATAMFASSANAQHPRLFPVRQYVPSSTPSDFATGDFNSDGYPDLVHTRASYSFLFLQLGGPGADFRPAPTQPDGEYELDCLGAADMNGDGELDLVLGPAGSGTVGVMLGDGAGILADPIWSSGGALPRDLVVADLDRDGVPDVATGTTALAHRVDLYRGLGNGDLAHLGSLTLPSGAAPLAVDAGDLDGDGNVDLVVANEAGDEVAVFLGTGGFGFSPVVTYPVGVAPEDVRVVDLDADGDLDVATADGGSGTVSILLGDGTGVLAPAVSHAVGGQPRALDSEDLDLDGLPDLAVAIGNHWNRRGTVLLRGTGGGGVASPEILEWGYTSVLVEIGDFDLDGQADLLSGNLHSESFSVLLAREPGVFPSSPRHPVGELTKSIAAGDFDNDGLADVCVSRWDSSTLQVLLGDGDGGFTGGTPTPCGPAPQELAAGDLNGDGNLDVVSADITLDQLELYFGDGSGGLVPAGAHAVGDKPLGLTLADLDRNGALDIVCGNELDGSVSILLGDGLGGFAQPNTVPFGEAVTALAIADLSSNGWLDILACGEPHGFLLRASGGGLFGLPEPKPRIGAWRGIDLGDLNGDGDLDVAANGGSSVHQLLGNGTGGFFPPSYQYFSWTSGAGTRIRDVDCDGWMDVLVLRANIQGSTLSIFFGDGTGVLTEPLHYALGRFCFSWALADFNGDRRLDVAAADSNLDEVVVLLGEGDPCGPTTYCVTQTNPLGCTPAISSSGRPSSSGASPFRITASEVPSQSFGMLFYGFEPNLAPFFGGTLCVRHPLRRTPVQFSGGTAWPPDCTGAYDHDFGAWLSSSGDPGLVLGAAVYGQYWFRDLSTTSGVGLTNGLHFVIEP